MPHFIAKLPAKTTMLDSGSALDFKLESGAFKLPSIRSPHIALIAMPYTYQSSARFCFLHEITRECDVLLKCVKSLRPTPIGIAKDALSRLSAHYEVLQDNLSVSSSKQQVSSAFLLGEREILDLVAREASALGSRQSTESKARFDSTILEIGFGSGRHILHLARQNPNALVLGLEIHTPSIEQVLRQIEILGLENLYLSCLDARVFLSCAPSHSLREIYIHFPVPWNKAKHRRVLNGKLLQEALRVLDLAGMLEFRTDDREYFNDVLEEASALESTAPKSFCVRHSINESQAITSKYEARWLRQSKDIYTIIVRPDSRGNASGDSSKEFEQDSSADVIVDSPTTLESSAQNFAFSFDEKLVKSLLAKVLEAESSADGFVRLSRIADWLCAQKFVLDSGDLDFGKLDFGLSVTKDSGTESALEAKAGLKPESSARGFLRIVDMYASSTARRFALLVSFGDFAYPCSRLVLFAESGQGCYLPEPPIPTQLNYKAHALFVRILTQVLERL